MNSNARNIGFPTKWAGVFALAMLVACISAHPNPAYAAVRVDTTELAQGANSVGGGTATLANSALDMVGVKANDFFTDESLFINFNGGNEIDQAVVAGSANVEMSFSGENEVEDIAIADNANVTINADGHNDFEEVNAYGDSSVTINVTDENDFESIEASDNASITIRGTNCQKRDEINLGEDETYAYLTTMKGDLTIDHVTVNLKCEEAVVGSDEGNVLVDTSKIGKDDDNEYAFIVAGGTMLVRESVIDITGTIFSKGQMTINHSDMKAEKPDAEFHDLSPYRVYSRTGIELIDEENGEVEEGEAFDNKVWYVDTDDNDGEDVDLEADGEPAYYRCKTDDSARTMPKTGDGTNPFWPMTAGIASVATAAYAARRREEQES